ncbi:MAG: LysR family transcriptional regulator [Pseudomonadota bacterium]|nr:LysR family transcriptional regulator [Pseudomonadota bacterium]
MRELRRLDLNLLVVLHTVLATQNVTAAARRLNMSQPAVSRALSRLRAVFGDPLFVKGAKGVIATPRAEALSSRVALLLAELEAAIEAPSFDPVTSTRVVRIATTDYGALAVLAPMIGRLVAEAPGIGIDIVPPTAMSFQELGSGELDIALYSDDPAPAALLSQTLFEETYISLVREGHPALPAKPNGRMPMKSFLAHAHILVNIAGGRKGVVDAALAASGRSRRVAMTLPYFATAALIVAQTDLVLTLPMRVADRFARPHGLVALRPPIEMEGFGYRLLWHPRSDLDPGGNWIRRRIYEFAAQVDRTPQ